MPSQPDLDQLRAIKTFPSLVKYLRDELDWPIETGDVEALTFEYSAQELGLGDEYEDLVKEIKQLRPLETNQPWGIFWVSFDKKRLPVVMLRRILGHLVLKKRAAANKATQRAWHLHDLLFISAYGEETDRAITFAHFSQSPDSPGDLPVLKVLGWDDGDTVLHLADAHRTLAEKLRWPAKPVNLDAWRNQWASAFTLRHREVITTTTELVEELARLADATRRRARTILARESERGPLRRLYAAFKTALIHDLTEDDFADLIAQTISYGLLIARFSRAAISAQNLVDMVPATNPFLRELLQTFLALAGRKSAFDFDELGIQDVVEVLNRANADAVKADFGNRTRGEDPVIHFYEHFLAAYDKKKKIQRGVFYTPQPVVSYIVRSVHELLQKEFDIEDGLASTVTWADMLKRHPGLKLPKIRALKAGKAEGEEVDLSPDEFFVMILDIATGTATFLVEVIEVIFQHLKAKWEKHGLQGMPIIRHSALRILTFKAYWNEYVPAALLPRLYGYELMMAPYTIAHMKLALKLSEINARLGQTDYLFKFEGRAHIYLTNTLEPPSNMGQQQLAGLFPALAHEAAAVNAVKHTKRFTVTIGNPPYAGNSANASVDEEGNLTFIGHMIEEYKKLDGKPVEEKQIKWLQDDYVKFIRIGQEVLRLTGTGVLGYITNHSYLDNPTFRGMRWNLGQDFPRLFVLDLHGNQKKKERCPDGSEDQNVFDIIQGVGLLIAAKLGKVESSFAEVRHAELWGARSHKYETLSRMSIGSTTWRLLSPASPFFLFVPQNIDLRAEYDQALRITEAFLENNVGFVTARDAFAVAFEDSELRARINKFKSANLSDAEIAMEYGLKDTTSWDLHEARLAVRADRNNERHFTSCMYRPFDSRRIYYSRDILERPVYQIHRHMLAGRNLAMAIGRAGQVIDQGTWNILYATRFITEFNLFRRGGNNLLPLFLYEDPASRQKGLGMGDARRLNLSPKLLQLIAARLALPQGRQHGLPGGLTPEDIFHYTYAVFHSPGYRSRYAEFLKMDFPRLPVGGNLELFRALACLGGDLVALHLLESPKLDKPITEYIGGRNPEVEKVSWSRNTVWLDKAQTTGFKSVREDVWNFHIGGYQVCEKWLKDRKGRTLTKADLTHYQRIVVALSETIRLMAEIDAVIEKHGGWPLK
jgi:predicted helicase